MDKKSDWVVRDHEGKRCRWRSSTLAGEGEGLAIVRAGVILDKARQTRRGKRRPQHQGGSLNGGPDQARGC